MKRRKFTSKFKIQDQGSFRSAQVALHGKGTCTKVRDIASTDKPMETGVLGTGRAGTRQRRQITKGRGRGKGKGKGRSIFKCYGQAKSGALFFKERL